MKIDHTGGHLAYLIYAGPGRAPILIPPPTVLWVNAIEVQIQVGFI